MAQDMFQGEMDPDIAELLGTGIGKESGGTPPDFDNLFNEDVNQAPENPDLPGVDLSADRFPRIERYFEPVAHNFFNDPNYYKSALYQEGDIAQRIHTILQKYLNTKDPKDRGVYRQQFITAYWDFLAGVAKKVPGKISMPKKFLLRYGILHPTFLDAETRDIFGKIIVENPYNLPIYYMDEWLKAVSTGVIRNSATDEVRIAKSNNQIRLQQLLEKAQGKLDNARTLLRAKNDERGVLERSLQERINAIKEHYPLDGFHDIQSCYTEVQKRIFGEIQELMKGLLKVDHDLELFLRDYDQAESDVKSLKDKIEMEGGGITVDVKALDTEFETIRQMTKLTIGRQGNHFPLLTSEYFHNGPNDIGTRENIISQLSLIESIDPEAFCRSYKNRLNRIIPYIMLIPSYGEWGICWEPFERFNRATSRGRIVIPMYPKSLYIAVLSAVADMRWQVAKEKASFYWMEEGLTGYYYQWFSSRRIKGDVKEFFIQDYITWMTKESEGIQKLDKEVRSIFWRYIPYPKEIREKLKTRSYVYQDLYQRDLNRAISDGY